MPQRYHNRVTFGARLAALAIMLVGALSLPAEAATKTLLVFGDSLVAGLGLPDADGFVAQLQAALSKSSAEVSVVNGGVSGDTTETALARLDWAIADRPDAVLVELGANDMLQGLPPEAVKTNLTAIMARLEAAKLPVLLAGMKANRGLGADYVVSFDALYPDIAAKYGVALYPFFLDGVALDPKLNQADMMHPNAAGVGVIVQKILPAISQLLSKIGK